MTEHAKKRELTLEDDRKYLWKGGQHKEESVGLLEDD
jgi:hypothetical protein